jgi:hypothetical protein
MVIAVAKMNSKFRDARSAIKNWGFCFEAHVPNTALLQYPSSNKCRFGCLHRVLPFTVTQEEVKTLPFHQLGRSLGFIGHSL